MTADVPDPTLSRWLKTNTYRARSESPDTLAALKSSSGSTVSVCLPALNEEATIGPICELISSRLMGQTGLVDELVVMDSGSSDGTFEAAAAAGATVYRAVDVAIPSEPVRGKGDCLWRSLAVLQGDIVVWLDSDTRNMHDGFITDLIAPLLTRPELVLTKGFYLRPLQTPDGLIPAGGARVTELVVRPLVQLLYPELTGFVQPLAGEYAARRDVLMELPFLTGYAVEIGLLIDIAERYGIDQMAQADLGTRVHRNRPVLELGTTAFEVMRAMLTRFDELGRIKIPAELPDALTQFSQEGDFVDPVIRELPLLERPPMARHLAG